MAEVSPFSLGASPRSRRSQQVWRRRNKPVSIFILVAPSVARALPDALLDLAQKRVVGRPLGRTKFARNDLLDFFRQLARDVGLAATEQKRAQAAREPALQC